MYVFTWRLESWKGEMFCNIHQTNKTEQESLSMYTR